MKKSIGPRSIVYPTPVFVVGTYDQSGNPNVMTAAWGGICCSIPPCVNISLRKATYTYGNIVESKAFTINIAPETYVKEADYFGIVSRRQEDKFQRTGLTPVRSELVHAPYIQEFPFVLECRLLHTLEIGQHTQFVGEILDIKIDEEMIGEKGLPDMEKIKPIIFIPDARTYHGVGNYLGKAFSIGLDIAHISTEEVRERLKEYEDQLIKQLAGITKEEAREGLKEYEDQIKKQLAELREYMQELESK